MSSIRVELQLEDGTFTTRMLHAGETVQQFERNVGQATLSVKKIDEASQGLLATMRDISIVVGLARAAISNLHAVTTGWAADIIKVNAEMERMGVLMKGLSTASDPIKDAADQVKYLREQAKNAPFSLKELTDTFTKMKSTGIDPMAGGFKAMTDAIASFGGSDEALKRTTIAITQMSGKGVIQMEELRQQLGEHVPRAVELMARSVGVSTGELIQKISKGTVEAKATLASFFVEMDRTFGGAAQQQMKTFNGMLSQSKTLLQTFALTTGETGFFDGVKKQLADFNAFLQSSSADGLARMIGQGLTTLVSNLRSAIDWVIKFRSEILNAAEIIAYTFGAKLAVNGLLGLSTMLGTAVTGIRTFIVAWNSMQLAMFENRITFAVRGVGALSTGMGALRLVAQNTAAALGVAGMAAGGIASVAVPLVAAVMAVAFAFGVFENKAKDAADELERFGANSRQQIMLAAAYLQQLEQEAERLKDLKRAQEEARDPNLPQVDYDGKIAANAAKQEALRKNISEGAVKVVRDETNAQIRVRTEAIDDQIMLMRKGYDEDFKLATKTHEEKLKELQKAKKSTLQEEESFQQVARAKQLRSYEEEIQLYEGHLRDLYEKNQTASEVQVHQNDMVIGALLGRQRQLMEARANLAKSPLGIQSMPKLDDYEKLEAKRQAFVDKLQESIAGNKATLAGASGELAKFVYMLEDAAKKKFGPLDNTELQKNIDGMKELVLQNEKLQQQVEGQSKFDKDLTHAFQAEQQKLFEARTRGMSDLDKIAIGVRTGVYEGLKPTSLMGRLFSDIDTSARKAAGGMAEAFGINTQTAGEKTVSIVQRLANAWGDVGNKMPKGSAVPDAGSSRGDRGGVSFAARFGAVNETGYVGNLFRHESGNNPDATPGNTTAEGLGQFLKSTWMDFLKEMHPEKLVGATEEQVLSLRKNRDLMVEATAWYAGRNADALGKKGIPVDDANLYLAHLLGPGGAIAALTKSADTMLRDIPQLNAARGANPQLNRLDTVGDLQAWARSFMGNGMTAPLFKDSTKQIDVIFQYGSPEQKALAERIIALRNERGEVEGQNNIDDQTKKIIDKIKQVREADAGLNTNLAATKKLISNGELFELDRNPDSDRYKATIAAAKELDRVEKEAADKKKAREKLKTNSEATTRDLDDLTDREFESRRRLQTGDKFKFSEGFLRVERTAQKRETDLRSQVDQGVLDPGQLEKMLAEQDAIVSRHRDLEVANALQAEQVKTREEARTLLTTDAAREAGFQEEVRRLQNLASLYSQNGELRAMIEKVTQEKIRVHRLVTDQSSPLGKMVKDWSDIGNNLQKAAVGWLDSATDKMAEFVATGKMNFKGLADSIMKDMTRMGLRWLLSMGMSAMGAPGGSGFGGGGTGKIGVPQHHNGGIAGMVAATRTVASEAFRHAQRLHEGGYAGFKPGEVPAVLMRGEEVGYPADLARKYGGGGVVSQSVHMPITVNATGGDPRQNQDLAEKIGGQIKPMLDAHFAASVRTQQRPGGMLWSGR